MGGTALAVWQALAADAGLNITVVNSSQDPEFAFMPPDHDGRIRMDCSSPAAMANLLKIREQFDLSFANDPDADRHGIVDAAGLMNPNHFLCVCVDYLLTHRPLCCSMRRVMARLLVGLRSALKMVGLRRDRVVQRLCIRFMPRALLMKRICSC